jgi:bloom syndrome protein
MQGLKSDYYHAGMTTAQRSTVQTLWQLGRVKVVCATIAYGMGVDNPNVRYVVHFTVPKCIEG